MHSNFDNIKMDSNIIFLWSVLYFLARLFEIKNITK